VSTFLIVLGFANIGVGIVAKQTGSYPKCRKVNFVVGGICLWLGI
jgi:hypothetical protein